MPLNLNDSQIHQLKEENEALRKRVAELDILLFDRILAHSKDTARAEHAEALLRDALPFVADATSDEDPEAARYARQSFADIVRPIVARAERAEAQLVNAREELIHCKEVLEGTLSGGRDR